MVKAIFCHYSRCFSVSALSLPLFLSLFFSSSLSLSVSCSLLPLPLTSADLVHHSPAINAEIANHCKLLRRQSRQRRPPKKQPRCAWAFRKIRKFTVKIDAFFVTNDNFGNVMASIGLSSLCLYFGQSLVLCSIRGRPYPSGAHSLLGTHAAGFVCACVYFRAHVTKSPLNRAHYYTLIDWCGWHGKRWRNSEHLNAAMSRIEFGLCVCVHQIWHTNPMQRKSKLNRFIESLWEPFRIHAGAMTHSLIIGFIQFGCLLKCRSFCLNQLPISIPERHTHTHARARSVTTVIWLCYPLQELERAQRDRSFGSLFLKREYFIIIAIAWPPYGNWVVEDRFFFIFVETNIANTSRWSVYRNVDEKIRVNVLLHLHIWVE